MCRVRIAGLALAAAIVVCAAAWVGAGTTGVISGVVRDSADGTPLSGANVVISGTRLTTVTDANGYFVIANVPPGEYEVTAEMVGFALQEIPGVQVTMDTTSRVDFSLTQEAIQESAVVVTRPRPMINAEVPHTLNLITSGQEDLTRTDSGSLRTVPGVLSSFPGIVVSPDGLGQMHMRGGRADQVGYYLEGIPVTDPNTGFFATNLFTTGVGKFQMYTGGFGAEYGNAISGVMNEVKKTGSQASGFNLDTEYGSMSHRNALFEVGGGSGSGRGLEYFVGSLSQRSDTDGPIVQEMEYNDNVVKLVWPSKNDDLTVMALQGSLAGKTSPIDTMRQRYAVGAVTWNHNFSPGSFVTVRPYYIFSTTVFNMLDSSGSLLDAWSAQKGLQVRYANQLSDRVSLGLGGSVVGSDNNYRQYFGMPFSDADVDTLQTDLYVDGRFRLGDRWALQTGLRYDRIRYDRTGLDYVSGEGYTGDPVPDASESTVTPRVGVSYAPDDRTAWKVSWGRYTKFAPSSFVQSVYADPDMPVDEYGTTLYESSPGLASTAPQRSSAFEVSFEKQFTETVSCRITPFYSKYENLVQMLMSGSGMSFSNVGEATSKGLEILTRKRLSNNWQGWVSYTYQIARGNSQSEYYPLMGPGGEKWYSAWDQRHTLTAVADCRVGRWRHNIRVDFGSGLADMWDPYVGEPQDRADSHITFSYGVAFDLPESSVIGDSVYLNIWNLFNSRDTLQYQWRDGVRTKYAWTPKRFISFGVTRAF